MESKNLLDNYMTYCINNGCNKKCLNTFAKMFYYEDYMIYKDILIKLLKIRMDNINAYIKKQKISVITYDIDNLPENAIYYDKSKIRSDTKIWFVTYENFMKILMKYNNEENEELVDNIIKLQMITVKFFKEYGKAKMVDENNNVIKIELDKTKQQVENLETYLNVAKLLIEQEKKKQINIVKVMKRQQEDPDRDEEISDGSDSDGEKVYINKYEKEIREIMYGGLYPSIDYYMN